ncbi:MAG: hypothetical protein ABR606_09010 [Vicinamibacterales bacterium]
MTTPITTRTRPPRDLLHSVGRATFAEWLDALARKRLTPRGQRPVLDSLSTKQWKMLETSEAGIFVSRTDHQAVEVKAVENPAPRSSFGFVDAFAQVDTKAAFLDGFLVLKTPVDRREHVVPSSLRLFRWDAVRGGLWVLHRADRWPGNRWTPLGDTLEGLQ